MSSAVEFHLIQRPAEGESAPAVIEIAGPAGIARTSDCRLSVQELDVPEMEHALCFMEPTAPSEGQHGLLMIGGSGARPLVNGLPALSVVFLRPRDLVLFPVAGVSFHAALFIKNPIGPVPSGVVRKTCVRCRTALTKATVVYRCVCGAVLCSTADGNGSSTEMTCDRLSADCPSCSRPICREGGYEWLPEEVLDAD